MKNIRYIFYFSPHQDDELLNLGAAICKDLDAGFDVFCVLCTDGGASGARQLIGDKGSCSWHEGRHEYTMDRAEFSDARDREYTESCLAMGITPTRIIIPQKRMPDGGSTVEGAKQIISDAIKDYPPEQVAVKTLAPVSWRHQNADHTALGKAALMLRDEGRCALLEEYLETILFPATEEQTILGTVIPNDFQRRRLLSAAAGYCRWEPEKGRFAVGFHSVADEFIEFEKEQFSRLMIKR